MSFNCLEFRAKYEHLRTVRDTFALEYERVREKGDLRHARELKRELEAARDALGLSVLLERGHEAAEQTTAALNTRFKEFGSRLKFDIDVPEGALDVTEEHLEVMNSVFGVGNLEARILPTLEELHGVNEEYREVMYPKPMDTQDSNKTNPKDKAAGLTSFRPDWWDRGADQELQSKPGETFGEVYVRSMQEELQAIGGRIMFMESIQKPKYRDGKQQYGTKAGIDASKDILVRVFQEVFRSPTANRFNHSWDDLNEKLLPAVKKELEEAWKSKGLEIPEFDVILLPALLKNLEMTLYHPENSTTDTSEWNSTVIMDKHGKVSGRRLALGNSETGGASCMDGRLRDDHWISRGVRLAVVFGKTLASGS